jgi:uncharacterized protein (TIRG00374 family)
MTDSISLKGRQTTPAWLWMAGILLSLIALALAVRGVRWDDVWAALRGANGPLVVLALMTVLLTTLAKANRWQWLLYPEHRRVRLRDVLAALLVGQMLNTLVPARAGDLARVYHLGAQYQVSKAAVLGSVVAEKTMDMVMLALCALVTLPWLYLVAGVQESMLALTVTAVAALLAVIALAWSGERLIERLAPWLARLPRGERLARLARAGVNGLQVLRSGRASLITWLWSLAVYILAASTNYVLFAAMDLRLPVYVGLLLMVVLHIGAAPPALPGRIGVFHGIAVLTLTAFGISSSMALAYGALLHLLIYIPPTLLGLLVLTWRSRRSEPPT